MSETKKSFVDEAINIVRGAGEDVSEYARQLMKKRESGEISREEYARLVIGHAKNSKVDIDK
ncbi:hypothetical protein Q9L42_020645 (plasmid) [Methylomarinum sp. Ch1-1]|uniref:Antitoxin VbhA domain-containing protein n=1 Tax=Methylomarinum roseum TaxID=3067653 RepID=A0AAU7P0E6_9GAMM